MNDLSHDVAQARYAALVAALGQPPADTYQRHILARLSMQYDQATIEALAAAIRRAIGQAVQPYQSIVAEIAPLVRHSKEVSQEGGIVIEVPQDLARDIIGRANGGGLS